ncbi:DUF192 domain-containing protein [Bacteroides heparinolyticus]|uniref:DUF192 domain-containing protein n=1 Tax=Prevotella heparinolytica TaxID=28113 RepID=UPI0035A15C49
MRLYSRESDFSSQIQKADNFWKRLKGLMGKDGIAKGEAMLFYPCGSIHTFFMKFNLDVLYLDRDNVVLAKESIAPWRLGKMVRGAKKVVEMAEGEAEAVRIGEKLYLD